MQGNGPLVGALVEVDAVAALAAAAALAGAQQTAGAGAGHVQGAGASGKAGTAVPVPAGGDWRGAHSRDRASWHTALRNAVGLGSPDQRKVIEQAIS
ncbi:hypothetical protein GCM10018780_89140 [Streptomyces lanatus]|nr:hypothetical protein GCM10018780_89140 [Streptomyces lanatus]